MTAELEEVGIRAYSMRSVLICGFVSLILRRKFVAILRVTTTYSFREETCLGISASLPATKPTAFIFYTEN